MTSSTTSTTDDKPCRSGEAEQLTPELYRGAFRGADTPALIADRNFIIRDVSQGGLDATGWDRNELVGQPATVVSDDDEVYEDIVQQLVNNEPWGGQFTLRTKDGSSIKGRGSTAPIVVDGETIGYVAVFVDMTRQHQHQNASKVLNRLLRHDLRNELNVMYGHIQKVRSRIDDDALANELDSAKAKIAQIVRRSERARDLRKLLEQSYGGSNHPVRLDIVLNNEIVKTMKTFDHAEFRFEEFPEVSVIADDLIGSAFEAVLENAIVHNDKNVPVVTVEVEQREHDVLVRISDNGPGVPDGQEDLIFGREEFDRLHHGTGVDLFFTDNVVSGYGGDVWVEDNEPTGAIFVIRLDTS